MKRLILIVLGVVLVVSAGAVAVLMSGTKPTVQLKAPHFVDSTPTHGETYAAQPINVTINFNFDLAEKSSISVKGDGKEWTAGASKIEDAQTALKADLKPNMPDGTYQVAYNACWPDGTCDKGSLAFSVDPSKRDEYKDLRGQKQVTVRMAEIKFLEPRIIVSPGTEVTWINDDVVGHFVNTETHPEHTYYAPQNSREIATGGSFKMNFSAAGQYNYHCSAHYPQMRASLLVLN